MGARGASARDGLSGGGSRRGKRVAGCLEELLHILGAGSLEDAEISLWIEAVRADRASPWTASQPQLEEFLERGPFESRPGRLAGGRDPVGGCRTARFNRGLADHGLKSAVHYAAFERLLRIVWERAGDGAFTRVLGDKHGGRHFYFGRSRRRFPTSGSIADPRAPS